jgi:hypothetical protein
MKGRCGDFLLQQKQVDKAIQVYIGAKHFEKALDLVSNKPYFNLAEWLKGFDELVIASLNSYSRWYATINLTC